jgi:hypothetical protein
MDKTEKVEVVRSLPCARKRRLEVQKWEIDSGITDGVFRYKDQQLDRKGYMKFENRTFVAKLYDGKSGVYVDDIIAVGRDELAARPKQNEYTQKALQYVQLALEEMDKNAVKSHGYSYSDEERNYQVAYHDLK